MTKIVIVDQHPAFRESLGMMLHEFLAEIQITGVETSHQFVSDLDQISPDLVIMDGRLPDRSGIETATIALAKKASAEYYYADHVSGGPICSEGQRGRSKRFSTQAAGAQRTDGCL